MSNANVSHLGQINGAGSNDSMFLKVFAGEVLTSFKEACVTEDKHMVRSISHGKSAQFPILGKTIAEYHTAGEEILGNAIHASERVITIDNLLLAHAFISNIEEAKNHYDVRATYTTEIGRALAYTYDKHILQLGVLAARGASPVTDEAGGGSVTEATILTDTSGVALVNAIFAAAQVLDEKAIPEDDRYIFLNPEAYYICARNTDIMNKDWGGSGVYSEGKVLRIAGMTVVKSLHTPFGLNINSGILMGSNGTYGVDATNTVGLVMHKNTVGTVKLLELGIESEYDIRRQGTLMLGKYAMGHGVLRPAGAVELKTV